MPPVQGSITWGNGYWNGYGFLGLEYPTPFSNPLVDPSLFVPAGGNSIGLNVNAPGACVTFSNVDGYQARWCTAPIGAEYRGYGGEVIAFVPGGW
jgi:hypothetical protein